MSCANVASVMLAHGIAREREIAVLAAIGAGRGRILQQLAVEAILLAAAGGAVGLVLVLVVIKVAPSIIPPGTLPPSAALAFNARIVAFVAALSAATGIVCGMAPAWFTGAVEPAFALGSGSRTVSRRSGTLRTVLASIQVGAAVLLLSGASLLLRTLVALNGVDRGFHADRVLTKHLSLPVTRYVTPDRALTFYSAAESEIAAIPGVQSVSFGGSLPLDGWNIGQSFTIVGDAPIDEAKAPAAHYQIVGARYFENLGIPLRRGRPFNVRDTTASPAVCIVNDEFVRRYARGRDPLDMFVSVQAMTPAGPTPMVRRVVGVVNQVKVDGPGEKENSVEIYVPITQNPWFDASLAVKTAVEPLSLTDAVKGAIVRVDRDQAVTLVRTMREVAAESTSAPRFRAELVGTFAVIGVTLAAAGVFGVLAFSVAQRAREFGIRLALGARPANVVRLILTNGLRIVMSGAALGLAATVVLSRLLVSLLFGVAPLDPITLLLVPAVLGLAMLAACAAPALRAAGVDPAIALRDE